MARRRIPRKPKYAEKDFLVTDLPRNRWKMFGDIVRNEWKTLLIFGLVFLLLCLPLILSHYYYLLIVNRIVNGDDPSMQDIRTASLIYYAVNFGILLIVGVFYGGVQRIYKRMAYGQGFLFGGDFLEGIRENWKENLIRFAIHGLLEFAFGFLSLMVLSKPILAYVLKGFHYGILRPAFLIGLFLGAVYSDHFGKKFFVSIVVFIKYLPHAMLMYTMLCWPSLLFLIGISFIQLFLPMILAFVSLPFGYLGAVLLANYVFDKAINASSFPDLVRKGLSPQ